MLPNEVEDSMAEIGRTAEIAAGVERRELHILIERQIDQLIERRGQLDPLGGQIDIMNIRRGLRHHIRRWIIRQKSWGGGAGGCRGWGDGCKASAIILVSFAFKS